MFNYDEAKAKYGAQRARQMEQDANKPPAATTPPAPAPPAPAAAPAPAPAPRPGARPAPAPAPAPAQNSPYGDLSGFKTYSDWRAASGADSAEIQNWYNQQVNRQPAGAPAPKPGAPAGTPAPAAGQPMSYDQWLAEHRKNNPTPTAGENLQEGYTAYSQQAGGVLGKKRQTPGTEEQQNTARLPAGTFPDDSPDAGNANTGDPYLDELRSGNLAGAEDWRRFSNAQLKAWQKYYIGGGQFLNDFGDVVGKPTEGGPKSEAAGAATGEASTIGYWRGDGGGVGGGGGAGGAGGGSSMTASSTPGGGDMQEWWKNLIQQTPTSRYTPEAMAAMEADQFARARAQEKLQLQQSRADQAQRGVARSQNQAAATRQIGVGTGQQIMANRADIQKRKIDADYQDKQAAIKNAQDYVNSMRDYMLRMEGNAIQREQMAAQIRLAQMNINAQKDLLEQQYQNTISRDFLTGAAG